jgi:hypothetical protein
MNSPLVRCLGKNRDNSVFSPLRESHEDVQRNGGDTLHPRMWLLCLRRKQAFIFREIIPSVGLLSDNESSIDLKSRLARGIVTRCVAGVFAFPERPNMLQGPPISYSAGSWDSFPEGKAAGASI